MFLRDFEYAERLTGSKGDEIINSAIERLKEKYTICHVEQT